MQFIKLMHVSERPKDCFNSSRKIYVWSEGITDASGNIRSDRNSMVLRKGFYTMIEFADDFFCLRSCKIVFYNYLTN